LAACCRSSAMPGAALCARQLVSNAFSGVRIEPNPSPSGCKRARRGRKGARRRKPMPGADCDGCGMLARGDWDPAEHPRAGVPPNPGWFAPTGGSRGGSAAPRVSLAPGRGISRLADGAGSGQVSAISYSIRNRLMRLGPGALPGSLELCKAVEGALWHKLCYAKALQGLPVISGVVPDKAFAYVIARKRVWRGIMHLPNDVALTTSNHHGKHLRTLYMLWSVA
jgi:hypothetical protein